MGRRSEYQPKGWGVKAGMVRVWVAGKTVRSPCYTWAVSERFRGVAYYMTKRYTAYKFTLFYFTLQNYLWTYRSTAFHYKHLALSLLWQSVSAPTSRRWMGQLQGWKN